MLSWKLKKIPNGWFITAFHSKSFTGSSLSISKASNHTASNKWKEHLWLNGSLIDACSSLIFLISINIIELEVVVFNSLGNTINLVLAFVHSYSGITCTYTVNFSVRFFLAKYWPLSHTYLYLHGVVLGLRSCFSRLQTWLLNKKVEVSIYVSPCSLILKLSVQLVHFLLLHKPSSLFSLFLHSFYVTKKTLLFL